MSVAVDGSEIPFPTTWDVKKPRINNGKDLPFPPISEPSMVLLMDEILHHLGCIKPYKQWDIYHINWLAGFCPSTVLPARFIQWPGHFKVDWHHRGQRCQAWKIDAWKMKKFLRKKMVPENPKKKNTKAFGTVSFREGYCNTYLVGGWTNPFRKNSILSTWVISSRDRGWK